MKKINIIIIILIILGGVSFLYLDIKNMKKSIDPKKKEPVYTNNFNLDLIKRVNQDNNDNYLISPYSIETALNMLKEGSNNNTYDEINKTLGNSKTELLENDKVKVANGIFISNKYKSNIKSSFLDIIKTNYDGEIIYDDLKTPKVINDWVNKKTDGMIPQLLNTIPEDFIIGLSNAIAIDVKWNHKFECTSTYSEKFTKEDEKKIDVEMMHEEAHKNYMSYFENNKSKGVTIDYEDKTLEFVGILPKTNIDDYIDNLEVEDLYNIETTEASEETHILLSLPRFSYSYDLSTFKKVLQDLGIKEAFIENSADLSNMLEGVSGYISEAIHKTFIELNETGTKAAAVTYFGIKENSIEMPSDDYKEIKIEFNKPFIYMIRDKSTKQILFFGVVKEPNKWKGSTCE